MKRLFVLALCLHSAMLVYAQLPATMVFGYDDNGNRVRREMLFTKVEDSENNAPKEHETLTSIVDSINSIKVSIFPNPTNDIVFVSMLGGENDQTMKADLIAMNGVVLSSITIMNTAKAIDLSGRTPGVYLLQLTINQEKRVWKVIKK